MNLLHRHRFILTFGVVISLLLWAHWALHEDEAPNTPAPIAVVTPTSQTHASTPAHSPFTSRSATASRPTRPDSGTFRGRVIDMVTRAPVRQFEVAFHGQQISIAGDRSTSQQEFTPAERSFRTNDGRFEWQGVPAGTWFVTVSARGYQRLELEQLQISTGKQMPEVVLPLRSGHTLRGRVYDEMTRDAIASASIGLRESHVGRFEGNWRMRSSVQTQKDGSFVLNGVPEGRVTLSVSAREHAEREVDVVVGAKTPPLEIGLSPGATIAGYLAAADGVTPIAGSVGLFDIDQGFGSRSKTSDAGEFSFEHLPAGRYRLTGQAGSRMVEREIALAADDRMEGMVLALSAAHSIRGKVTGLQPEDLKRVSVTVQREGDAGSPFGSVGVDSSGAYAIEGVEPGRVQLVADASMRRQISKTIEMPGDTDVTVDLEFPRGARLTGYVTRAGKPLPGAWLQSSPLRAQDMFIYGTSTSSRGEYAIEGLPPGEYYLRVGGYRSRVVEISGDTVFDVDIPLSNLSGRVVEEADTMPIMDASVDIRSTSYPKASPIRLQDRSDHYGQFSLAGLEPGEFVLTAYKPGYEMYRERISYGSPISDMTIRLRRASGVEVRAQEARGGKPVRSLRVSEMIGDRSGSDFHVVLDENGIGYLPSALAGSTLSFSANGYEPRVVRSWNGQGLELELEPLAQRP